jgi:hypothetical protein
MFSVAEAGNSLRRGGEPVGAEFASDEQKCRQQSTFADAGKRAAQRPNRTDGGSRLAAELLNFWIAIPVFN